MSQKILVFGAGVLGSLYSAYLHEAGFDVRLLARGRRLQDIYSQGVILQHAYSGKRIVSHLQVVETLSPSDNYDYIIVLVRKNQLEDVLKIVGNNEKTPNIVIMVNNASGYQSWIEAVGRERLMLGFAGAGGAIENGVVTYALAPAFFQPTTLAELDGRESARLKEIKQIFWQAGFPVAITSNMDAWQKTHVAWVSPLAQAIYRAEREGVPLSSSKYILKLTVEAIRESFDVLEKSGIAITPRRLKFWKHLPAWLLVESLCLYARTTHFKTLVLRHSLAARDEMKQLADEFFALADLARHPTPALERLIEG